MSLKKNEWWMLEDEKGRLIWRFGRNGSLFGMKATATQYARDNERPVKVKIVKVEI